MVSGGGSEISSDVSRKVSVREEGHFCYPPPPPDNLVHGENGFQCDAGVLKQQHLVGEESGQARMCGVVGALLDFASSGIASSILKR